MKNMEYDDNMTEDSVCYRRCQRQDVSRNTIWEHSKIDTDVTKSITDTVDMKDVQNIL